MPHRSCDGHRCGVVGDESLGDSGCLHRCLRVVSALLLTMLGSLDASTFPPLVFGGFVFGGQKTRPTLLFGKRDDDTFSLDFRWPMTPLQAIGIALSSFESSLRENIHL